MTTKKNTNTALEKISEKIKALEKRSISHVIEIGRLLHEAAEQCEHGEYMAWLKREFAWSHDTAMNYRSAYELSQIPKFSDFDKLDISISALYLVAKMKGDDQQAARVAIIEEAKQRRVSYSRACDIIEKLKPPSIELDPPPAEPEPPADPVIAPNATLVPDDETPSPDEAKPPPSPDEDAPPSELIEALNTVLRYLTEDQSDVWPKVVKSIGGDKLRQIVDAMDMEAPYVPWRRNKNTVRAKADRAEAKAKQR